MITEENIRRFFSKGIRGRSCRPVAVERDGDGFVFYGPLWKRRCAKRVWDAILESTMTQLEFKDSSLYRREPAVKRWARKGLELTGKEDFVLRVLHGIGHLFASK